MGTLINDCDKCFIDSIAQEVNRLAGVTITIFLFQEEKSTRDVYYGESKERVYRGDPDGIKVPAFFESPDRSPVAGEEGFRFDKSSRFFIAKKDMNERNMRPLVVGDIINAWGLFYDVKNATGTPGRFSDTGETSLYEVEVVRRTKSLPEGLRMDRP